MSVTIEVPKQKPVLETLELTHAVWYEGKAKYLGAFPSEASANGFVRFLEDNNARNGRDFCEYRVVPL